MTAVGSLVIADVSWFAADSTSPVNVSKMLCCIDISSNPDVNVYFNVPDPQRRVIRVREQPRTLTERPISGKNGVFSEPEVLRDRQARALGVEKSRRRLQDGGPTLAGDASAERARKKCTIFGERDDAKSGNSSSSFVLRCGGPIVVNHC